MQSGWLLRDGEVLASTVCPSGWRSRIVTPRSFADDVGAIVLNGPVLCWRVTVARTGEASRLRTLDSPALPRIVGPLRHGVALRREVAARLRVGDDLELRVTL